jgi:hypothetical protein
MPDDIEPVPHDLAAKVSILKGQIRPITEACRAMGLDPVFYLDPFKESYGTLRGVRKLRKR